MQAGLSADSWSGAGGAPDHEVCPAYCWRKTSACWTKAAWCWKMPPCPASGKMLNCARI